MLMLLIKTLAVLTLYNLQKIMTVQDNFDDEVDKNVTGDSTWNVSKYLEYFIKRFGEPLGQHCISCLYTIYVHFTVAKLAVFFFKYVTTTVFMYKYIKNFYTSSKERLKLKQLEFEDIKLQVEIVETKISVREAEFTERTEELRVALERLRNVRERVRQLLATDEDLRRAFETTPWEPYHNAQNLPEQEQEFMMEIMKKLKYDQASVPERETDKMECGEHVPPESNSPVPSVYSSISDSQKDCQIKIVKVTNVYKVAYLRHFIKQKKLRRATKQALLKKKMENIKKLLDDWQKTLNMVINSKLAILDTESNRIEVASQEAMGDYTKPQLREFSDSDSDLSLNQNPYRNGAYCYEEDLAMSHDYYDPREFKDMKGPPTMMQYDYNLPIANKLFIVAEETSSQLAIAEVKSEAGDDWDNRDIVTV